MKKQIEGQINLFDYISEEDKKDSDKDFKKDFKKDSSKDSKGEDYVKNHRKSKISLFAECTNCWCSTCSHNTEGRAVPRDFAGVKKPCPSCDFCISQKKPEICEIGSYDNGCRLRAEEEGIMM